MELNNESMYSLDYKSDEDTSRSKSGSWHNTLTHIPLPTQFQFNRNITKKNRSVAIGCFLTKPQFIIIIRNNAD